MPNDTAAITIVSGLPRSGTSLMMQMLEAGGIPLHGVGAMNAVNAGWAARAERARSGATAPPP